MKMTLCFFTDIFMLFWIFANSESLCPHGTAQTTGENVIICIPCQQGLFGSKCSGQCQCKNGECDRVNGSCYCPPGYIGDICDRPCPSGMFGEKCSKHCNCTNGAECDRVCGICDCPPGYTGRFCQLGCPSGTYGKDCSNSCKCTNNGQCNMTTGKCDCEAGFTGKHCEIDCPPNKFGKNCSDNCQCKNGAECKKTGYCDCLPGYMGEYCKITCPREFHGKRCSEKCLCENNAECNRINGTCNCPSGFTGIYCQDGVQSDSECQLWQTFVILMSIFGFLLLLSIFYIIKKQIKVQLRVNSLPQRKSEKTDNEQTAESQDTNYPESIPSQNKRDNSTKKEYDITENLSYSGYAYVKMARKKRTSYEALDSPLYSNTMYDSLKV